MTGLLEVLLQSCAVPWWRRASLRWSLAWGALYAAFIVTVIVLSLGEPPLVIGKRVLAAHAGFAFASFFGTVSSQEECPQASWERAYAAAVSLTCLLLLTQAAFAFAGVRSGIAWLAGAMRNASFEASATALLSFAFGFATYALMAIETRAFRRFVLRLRRRPMRSL